MQAKELSRIAPSNQSFTFGHTRCSQFIKAWHYHEELELIYIARSTGTVFVGDSITSFQPGTFILLGANLPHAWLNDDHLTDDEPVAESYKIFFTPDCFGKDFFTIPEMGKIREMLEEASRGLEFSAAASPETVERLSGFAGVPEHRRPLALLEILTQLTEYQVSPCALSSPSFIANYQYDANSKIAVIYDYVLKNFKGNISLSEAAATINMNASAFSRYFSQKVNKNFIQFVNETRIGYACKLLSEAEYTISEVAYASGFNNTSYFNKRFKLHKGITPKEYYRAHKFARSH